LQVHALQKTFGSTRVLDRVSFVVEPGECVALLGASGCGKTTTLRCIGGLERPDSGEIRLEDRLLNGAGRSVPPQERQVGMVFQSFSVWPHLTVFENVAFGLRVRRVREAEIRKRVHAILEMMFLEPLAERRSSQLSGGQLQRVALARTLVVEPKLVLFDEPLSNLDARLRGYMRIEIRSLLKRIGMSAVFVTHDQLDASVVADRTALMNRGRIEQIGTWKQLYFSPASAFVAGFMSSETMLAAKVLEAAADGTRIQIGDGPIDLVVSPSPSRSFAPGDAVVLYIPREAVTLRPAGRGLCAGRVEAILPSPGYSEVTVNLGADRRLVALTASGDGLPELGAECSIDFDVRYLRLLPKSDPD
jgi:ABC-type Fe3+/spermidine/putrescine transport system ATPase subunit